MDLTIWTDYFEACTVDDKQLRSPSPARPPRCPPPPPPNSSARRAYRVQWPCMCVNFLSKPTCFDFIKRLHSERRSRRFEGQHLPAVAVLTTRPTIDYPAAGLPSTPRFPPSFLPSFSCLVLSSTSPPTTRLPLRVGVVCVLTDMYFGPVASLGPGVGNAAALTNTSARAPAGKIDIRIQ